MKKLILGLVALSTISSLALPVQAKDIASEKNSVETEQVNLKSHRRHGRYRKCYYDRHKHKKVCYWVRHDDHHRRHDNHHRTHDNHHQGHYKKY